MPAPRRALIAAVLLAALVTTAACAPATPDPAPSARTPTPLSDADAFAAAEETYRAYVDALNAVDLSDPTTFEPVFALTTGDALAGERRSLTTMHAEGWVKAGAAEVTRFEPRDRDGRVLTALVCYDVSGVEIADDKGNSQSTVDRVLMYALLVDFQASSEKEGYVIASSEAVEDPTCEA